MKTETFHLELLTPCFCAGAEPDQQAEIRAPSIRGQLRWWFRTLGGFKSLTPMPARDQETMIFGSTAGDEGRAGKLIVRVAPQNAGSLTASVDHPTPDMASAEGYLLFPLRKQIRKKSSLPRFALHVLWRGNPSLWEDIRALVSVFGHLGSLGFRGRRAMGALAFVEAPPREIREACGSFDAPHNIVIKQLPATSARDAISVLASWLRSCRAHGRSGQNEKGQQSPFFKFAKTDHDIGYRMPGTDALAAMRPALGLPIIQRTSDGTNNWEWNWDQKKRRAEGRFASPVILRPHREGPSKWRALVIFVDAHKWPDGKQVFLNGKPRTVSLDLYEAMKADRRLSDFLG